MNLLGIPIILSLNSKIKHQEENLQMLRDIEAEYLETVYEHEYKREKALGINIDEKDIQPMEGVIVSSKIAIKFKKDKDSKELYLIPSVTFKNESDNTYNISAIEGQYFIVGGEDGKLNYPTSELFDIEGKFIQSFRGSKDKIKIAPRETTTVIMPQGYCTVLYPNSDYIITAALRKFLDKKFGTSGEGYDSNNGGVIPNGERMNIAVVWTSDDSDDKQGYVNYTLVQGDLEISNHVIDGKKKKK